MDCCCRGGVYLPSMGKLIFSLFLRVLMVRRIEGPIPIHSSGIAGGRCCWLATWLNNFNIGREEVLGNERNNGIN